MRHLLFLLLLLLSTPADSLRLTSIAIGQTANDFVEYLTGSFTSAVRKGAASADGDDALIILTDTVPPERPPLVSYIEINEGNLPVVPNKVTVKENKYQQVHWQWMDERKRGRLSIKSLKADLFKVIAREEGRDIGDDETPLVFIDSDIVVSSVREDWVAFQRAVDEAARGDRGAGRRRGSGPPAFACFRDIGNTGSPFHTGVLVLWPSASRDILRWWGEAIVSGDYPADQAALADLVEEHDIDDQVAILDHTRFFAFLNGTVIRSAQPPLFTHMTKYRLSNPTLFHYTLDELSRWLSTRFGVRDFCVPE
jgi:hypothetical protein